MLSKTRQKLVNSKSNVLSTFVTPKLATQHVTRDALPEITVIPVIKIKTIYLVAHFQARVQPHLQPHLQLNLPRSLQRHLQPRHPQQLHLLSRTKMTREPPLHLFLRQLQAPQQRPLLPLQLLSLSRSQMMMKKAKKTLKKMEIV